MTNRYLIHAWCVRPFIAYLDPVEAATPEEAIALARRQPATLLDAAEECNPAYLWDEFAAHDESGREVLHVLDAEARLRQAAPALLAALQGLLDAISWLPITFLDGPAYDALYRAGRAIANATGRE
jgi:hypothetical protein